jgi:hypothetical protein
VRVKPSLLSAHLHVACTPVMHWHEGVFPQLDGNCTHRYVVLLPESRMMTPPSETRQ